MCLHPYEHVYPHAVTNSMFSPRNLPVKWLNEARFVGERLDSSARFHSLIYRPVMKPTQSGDENSKPTFTQLPCFSALREDWDRAGERAHATSGQWARFRTSDCYFMLPYYSVSRKCVCNPASIFVLTCRPYSPQLSYRIYSNKRRCTY